MVAYGMHRYDMSAYFSRLTSIHTLGAALQISCGVGVPYALALVSFHIFESPFLSLKRRFEYMGVDRLSPRLNATSRPMCDLKLALAVWFTRVANVPNERAH